MRASRFEHFHHGGIAATARQTQGPGAVAVRQVEIRLGVDQVLERGLVIGAAIAQHDGLDDGGPAEVVHVVERRAGANELAHHLGMAEMRCGYERRAVVAAGRAETPLAGAVERMLDQLKQEAAELGAAGV